MPTLSTLRLLQLCSPNLPVGGFSFSQGLEYAIDSAWLRKPQEIEQWVQVVMLESLARQDLPILLRLKRAYAAADETEFENWRQFLLASRESAELYQAEVVMGQAIYRLLNSLHIPNKNFQGEALTYMGGFAIAAQHWEIADDECLQGFLWSWLENQVAAATKLLPMGQTDGQRMLLSQAENIPIAVSTALKINNEEVGSNLPALSMACAWHETQYSRLFRS